MGNVFWICGYCEGTPGSQVSLAGAINKAGIQIERINRVDWVTSSSEAVQETTSNVAYDLPSLLPVFYWPYSPFMDHLLIQNACRMVETQEAELVLCVDHHSPASLSMNLIASPSVVGRCNILPMATLHAHHSGFLPQSTREWQQLLAKVFQSNGLEIPNNFIVSTNQELVDSLFDPRYLLLDKSIDAATRLCRLVKSMQQNNNSYALLLSTHNGLFMLSILEKV